MPAKQTCLPQFGLYKIKAASTGAAFLLPKPSFFCILRGLLLVFIGYGLLNIYNKLLNKKAWQNKY